MAVLVRVVGERYGYGNGVLHTVSGVCVLGSDTSRTGKRLDRL
jgi:hypothetical protein